MVSRDDGNRHLWLTYSSLRWLLFILPLVLFAATVGTAMAQGYLETSISAYYGGPVRDVFVGVLIAVAACMVAYQGATTLEDYTFNGAAFYAVLVALIPHNIDEVLQELRAGLELSGEGFSAVDYVWSLRITLGVVVLLCFLLVAFELRRTQRMRRLVTEDRASLLIVLVTAATLLAFLLLTMWQLWAPDAKDVSLEGIRVLGLHLPIHHVAAVLLLVALVVATAMHAWPGFAARRSNETLGRGQTDGLLGYRIIVVLMLLGPLVCLGIARLFAPGHYILFLEWWEIGFFCLFWGLENLRVARQRRRLLSR